jgi:hypothetical protein
LDAFQARNHRSQCRRRDVKRSVAERTLFDILGNMDVAAG